MHTFFYVEADLMQFDLFAYTVKGKKNTGNLNVR